MSREQGKSFVGLRVPNSQAVVFASGNHQTCILVGLALPDGAPVALELALTLKVPRLEFRIRVKVKHLDLSSLSAKHKHVASQRVIADFADAENRVGVDVLEVLHGVGSRLEFLGLKISDVHYTLERRRD